MTAASLAGAPLTDPEDAVSLLAAAELGGCELLEAVSLMPMPAERETAITMSLHFGKNLIELVLLRNCVQPAKPVSCETDAG